MRTRESAQLKTVLELCDMEIHQHISVPNCQKLNTMVKRSTDQILRLRNFDARHGKLPAMHTQHTTTTTTHNDNDNNNNTHTHTHTTTTHNTHNNKQNNKQTNKQTDRQTDRQTNKQTNKQTKTNKQPTNEPTNQPTNQPTSQPANQPTTTQGSDRFGEHFVVCCFSLRLHVVAI